jgi:Trk K+ transport system NAD-binding subunit
MKAFPSQLAFMIGSTPVRRNVGQLLRLLALLIALVTVYSITFHYLMEYEDRHGEFSWFTGFYWTMTVMSTLGFGDITFHSDLGRAFAMIVLISGLISLLIIFPFTFIQFFWAPWLEAQRNAQAPRSLPAATRGHTIITTLEPVAEALLRKLVQYNLPYVLLTPTVNEALELTDQGYRVMVGAADSPETYHRAQVGQAALVVTTSGDEVNTNVAFTVREISRQVPIVTVAGRSASTDILELAGSDHVLQLGEMLGQALARRAGGSQTLVHTVGRFEQLCIAEVTVGHTPLAGIKVRDSGLRERYGVTLAGLWDRGRFQVPGPDDVLGENVVAILVGPEEQLHALNADLAHEPRLGAEGPVLIIGGGRVGRAAAALLQRQGTPCRVLERDPAHVPPGDDRYVLGDAAELEVLQQAGLSQAPTVIITTQDDDTNIYLTIYCRRLRPDLQIVCRATHDRNVDTLHRAGADFVMSYASLGASTIFNLLRRSNLLMVTEGLLLLRVPTPGSLVGRTIANSAVRGRTGCSIVALLHGDRTFISPSPDTILPAGSELVLIGTVEAEQAYLRAYGPQPSQRA